MPKYGGNYRQYRDRRGTAHHGGKITTGISPRSTLKIIKSDKKHNKSSHYTLTSVPFFKEPLSLPPTVCCCSTRPAEDALSVTGEPVTDELGSELVFCEGVNSETATNFVPVCLRIPKTIQPQNRKTCHQSQLFMKKLMVSIHV